MKIRALLLAGVGFLVAAILLSIPNISRTSGDIIHYLLSDLLEKQPLSGQAVPIEWEDAERLLLEGHVRRIMIPHSGQIIMKLDNGMNANSQEPYSGAANDALQTAPNRRWIRVSIE